MLDSKEAGAATVERVTRRGGGEGRRLGRRQVVWGLTGLWEDVDFNSFSGGSEEWALSSDMI